MQDNKVSMATFHCVTSIEIRRVLSGHWAELIILSIGLRP